MFQGIWLWRSEDNLQDWVLSFHLGKTLSRWEEKPEGFPAGGKDPLPAKLFTDLLIHLLCRWVHNDLLAKDEMLTDPGLLQLIPNHKDLVLVISD